MLTIVIPTYSLTDELEELAEYSALSYKEHGADEVIIVEDGGNYSNILRKAADLYLYCQNNSGFTKTVNRGWKLSSGDFTAIVNSDTYWLKGNLKDLCIKDKVTSPNVVTGDAGYMAGSFFVVPRPMQEKYGMLNEKLKNFCSDTDFEWRIYPNLLRVNSVEVGHDVNQTLKAKYSNWVNEYNKDNELYHKLIKEGKAHAPSISNNANGKR